MVQESSVIPDTFAELFTILNNNVTQVTNAAGDTITLRKNNGNYWTGSFPDIDVDDSSNYPIGVLDTPDFDSENSGFSRKTDTLVTDISVYGSRKEHPPRFANQAWDAIQNNEDSLKGVGLYGLTTNQSQQSTTVRDKIKVYEYTIPVVLKFDEC